MGEAAQQWYYAALGLAALGGLFFGLYKLRPESTKVFIESAEGTVRMAHAERDRLALDVASLRADVKQLRADFDDLNARHRQTTELLRDTRTLFRLLQDYTRQLQMMLATQQVKVPEPPPALLEHLTDPPPGWPS